MITLQLDFEDLHPNDVKFFPLCFQLWAGDYSSYGAIDGTPIGDCVVVSMANEDDQQLPLAVCVSEELAAEVARRVSTALYLATGAQADGQVGTPAEGFHL